MTMKNILAIAFACAFTVSGASAAAPYPERPVRVVLGFAPGGGADLLARPIGQWMSETLGQQFVIDNRPGANGIISLDIVARSPTDGYTLALTSVGPLSINPGLYEKLSYDPVKDFEPAILLASGQYVLLVHRSVAAKTVGDVLRLAKAKPGALTFGSSGIGSPPHLAGELLKLLGDIDMIHVPYKGTGPALMDLLAGQYTMMFTSIPAAIPHVKSAKVDAIAVSGSKRSRALPYLPTVAEAGLSGFEADGWYGVLAPANTPRARIALLNATFNKALDAPEIRARMTVLGLEPVGGTPAAFAGHIRQELAKWPKVIRHAGIKVE